MRRGEMYRALGHCDSRRNPDDLRFTKGTINLDFPSGQLQCENIYDVLNALENKKLIPWNIPSLRVISHGSQLWTLDNKLLYICRISPKVKRVSVVHVSGQRFVEKFLHENSAVAIQRMSKAEFFPKVNNCDKSPRADLTFRADLVRLSTVKKIPVKEKIRGKRSAARESSSPGRLVSSTTTVTSRISSQNTETGTPFSIRSTCANKSDSKASSSRRDASTTNSSGFSSEETVDTNTECYPAVRSMTGHYQSEDSHRIAAEEEHENACTKRRFSFSDSFSDRRPSTCQESFRFSRSLQRFPTAPRASRLLIRTSTDALTRLEPRSSTTAQPTDSPSAAFLDDSREQVRHSWLATFRDNHREYVSQSVSARFPEEYATENVSQSIFSNFPDNSSSKIIVSQSFAAKSQNNPPENVSHGLSSKLDIGEDEPDDDFQLEAFVLPDHCSLAPKIGDSKCDDEKGISPFHTSQRPSGTPISSRQERLDRSVSSCSSSTERPMKKPQSAFSNKGEPRRKGNEGSSLQSTFSLLQRSNIGRSLSPLRRASVSAGRTMKCHLSAEHEFEVSKQILLKHLKKAFFSVC